MATKIKKYNNITWINVIEPNAEDLKYLKNNFKFHPLDLKDVEGESQRSKIDIYSDYAFIILRFPVTYKSNNLIGSHELDIFLNKDTLITVQKKKVKILNQYFYKVANNKKLQNEVYGSRAAVLLYHVLEEMYRASLKLTDSVLRDINQIENQVYEEYTRLAVKNLATARRNVLTFKSVIEPQRSVIRTLVGLKTDYLSGDLANYFDDIADYIDRIYTILATGKELIDGLHETNESLTTYRLNRVMKILTIFSVSMLPLTLLTGIYGMNLQSLPLIHNEGLVWYIFGGLAAVIIIIFAVLKKRDII